jgi:hypothetical protein
MTNNGELPGFKLTVTPSNFENSEVVDTRA